MSTESAWVAGDGGTKKRGRWLREAVWFVGLAAAFALVFGVVMPWIDAELNPPFGQYWPGLGRTRVPTLRDLPLVLAKAIVVAYLVRLFARRAATSAAASFRLKR